MSYVLLFLLAIVLYVLYAVFNYSDAKWYKTKFMYRGSVLTEGEHRKFFVETPVVCNGLAYVVSKVSFNVLGNQIVLLRNVSNNDLFKINGNVAKDISDDKYNMVTWRDKNTK